MTLRLGVRIGDLRSCIASLMNCIGRPIAKKIFGYIILTAATIGDDVEYIDLIATVEEVRRPTLAIIRRVKPDRTRGNSSGNQDDGFGLLDLLSRCELFDVNLVGEDAGGCAIRSRYISSTNIEGVPLVGSFRRRALRTDCFDTCAVCGECARQPAQ